VSSSLTLIRFRKTFGASLQGAAVLGIAMVAMSEELGTGMAVRTMEHLLQYGEPAIRRAVPLAMGLLSMSSPQITVTDTLGRLSHDTDEEVAMAAVFSLGLVRRRPPFSLLEPVDRRRGDFARARWVALSSGSLQVTGIAVHVSSLPWSLNLLPRAMTPTLLTFASTVVRRERIGLSTLSPGRSLARGLSCACV
jgi:hypothetical protein